MYHISRYMYVMHCGGLPPSCLAGSSKALCFQSGQTIMGLSLLVRATSFGAPICVVFELPEVLCIQSSVHPPGHIAACSADLPRTFHLLEQVRLKLIKVMLAFLTASCWVGSSAIRRSFSFQTVGDSKAFSQLSILWLPQNCWLKLRSCSRVLASVLPLLG